MELIVTHKRQDVKSKGKKWGNSLYKISIFIFDAGRKNRIPAPGTHDF